MNLIREHHKTIKDGFDHLDKLASSGPASKEFVEPKVQGTITKITVIKYYKRICTILGLWRIALESNFTNAELQSLKTELFHYENR